MRDCGQSRYDERMYDQTKRCPRCQLLAPELKTLTLDACLFCNFPGSDPRYDPFAKARQDALDATNKRRC